MMSAAATSMIRVGVPALALMAVMALLAGCQREAGPLEKAGKAVDQTLERAGEQVEKTGDQLRDAARGKP